MQEDNQKKPIDVYAIVTERIIAHLEKGVVPWQQPWTKSGPPRNLVTGKPYRGINTLLLGSLNYAQNVFLTYKQARELGAHVKKGEESQIVVFWNWQEKENRITKEKEKIPFLRYYRVFNVAQCEGIPKEKLPPAFQRVHNPIKACEEIIATMPNRPAIRHNKHEAYYSPTQDYINMPKPETFKSGEHYYGVLFHELVHSTGHTSRLNRKEVMDNQGFGSDRYSVEELTAEIGASFLKSNAGIPNEHLKDSAAYIQHWLKELKNDKRFIVHASAQAQKAADYITNVRELDKINDLPDQEKSPGTIKTRNRISQPTNKLER